MGIPRGIKKTIVSSVSEGAEYFWGSFPVAPSPPNETFFELYFFANPWENDEQAWTPEDPLITARDGVFHGSCVYIHLPIVAGGLPGRFHTVSVWYSMTGFSPFRELDYETCGTQQPFCKQFYIPVVGHATRILVKLDCENFTPFPLVQEYMIAFREYWPTFLTPDPFHVPPPVFPP